MSASRPDPFPFFVGRGRSGTTLLRAMFDSHPDMAVPDEAPFVVQMALNRKRYEADARLRTDVLIEDLSAHPLFWAWEIPRERLQEEFRSRPPSSYSDAIRILYRMYAEVRGKPRYADKTPGSVLRIELLARLFAEAVFIHLIRDGRDVALSQLDVEFGSHSLEEAAVYWKRAVLTGRRAGYKLGPERYREVSYEELIDNPTREVTAICDFIELPFDESMLRYFERADEVTRSMEYADARASLYLPPTKGLRDWRRQMDDTDAALFQALAGRLLTQLGYEPGPRPDARTRFRALSAKARVEWGRLVARTRVALRRLRNRRAPPGSRQH